MTIDWKAEYEKLAKRVDSLYEAVWEMNEASYTVLGVIQSIKYEANFSRDRDLLNQGKVRLCRLTRDIQLVKRYDSNYIPEPVLFSAGTLINAKEIEGKIVTIYLDDGYWDFPADALEMVVVNDAEVNWDKVTG